MTAEQRARMRASQLARRQRLMAAGVCYLCGTPLEDKARTVCPDCLKKRADYMRERRKWLKLSGACIFCGRIAREDRVLCERCAQRQKEYVMKRKEKGYEDQT